MDPKPEEPVVTYVCGDCGHENTLKRGDVFKCRECGFRVHYKKRTRIDLTDKKPKTRFIPAN